AEEDTLADYRASADDAIEQLIGARPDLGPQEKVYLEKTLKRWQAFAARQGDDERSQAVRAEGHFRVAFLWQKLFRRNEARTEYETAHDLLQNLADALPAEPFYRLMLARTHNNLGVLRQDLGRHDAAHAEFNAALNLLQKLTAAFPTDPDYQWELTNTHNSLGILL